MWRFGWFMACAGVVLTASGQCYDYRVDYREGFVDMTAGYGHVTMDGPADGFSAVLGGQSVDWAGHIYSVADTMVASFATEPRELSVSYINGVYRKPRVGEAVCESTPFRNIFGEGSLSCDPGTMQAVVVTAEMLGLYAVLPALHGQMEAGECVDVPIVYPQGRESLSLTYEGDDSYVFTYTWDGVTVPYPVTVTVDCAGVPQSFSASLRIGHLSMARY